MMGAIADTIAKRNAYTNHQDMNMLVFWEWVDNSHAMRQINKRVMQTKPNPQYRKGKIQIFAETCIFILPT
jgi:hypothetical protein